MKKMMLLFAIALFASPYIAAAAAPASDFVPIAPIPGLTEGASVTSASMADFFNNLYKYLIGAAAVIAVIMIIWGGVEYATTDSIGNKSEGKAKIQQAILGLILVLLPVLVFSIINPKILNLSASWQAIGLPSNIGTINNPAGPGNPAPPVTDVKTGCTVRGSVLKTASCPTQQAAADYAASCGTGWSGHVEPCQTELPGGRCGDASIIATCSQTLADHMFIDVSQAGFSYTGIFNTVTGYSKYEAVGSTPTNQNNGQEIVSFASACSTDGGTTCLSTNVFSTTCTYTTPQPTSQSNKCYLKTTSCITDAAAFYSTQLCGKNVQFKIIP